MDDLFSGAKHLNWTDKILSGNFNYSGSVPAEVLATVIVQALVVVVGILANIIVIAVIILARIGIYQETSSIIYVMNLSISNLVFLLFVPYKWVEDILLKWIFGQTLCQMVIFVKLLNFSVVAMFLMVMSIDRFLAVNRALTANHWRSQCVSKIVCVVVWVFSIAGVLPLALVHSSEDEVRCSPKFPDEANFDFVAFLERDKNASCRYRSKSQSLTIWTVWNFCYSFFIPLFVIVCCYSAIICKVREPEIAVNAQGLLSRTVKRKVTKMSAMLVLSYAVCYTPYHVWQVLRLVGVPVPSPTVCFNVERFNATMAYANSALHPILYASASGQFSKQYEQAKRHFISYWRTQSSRPRLRPGKKLFGSNTRTVVIELGNTTKLLDSNMNGNTNPKQKNEDPKSECG